MSDTPLETICITGSRPPYKIPAWGIGQVKDESRVQTAPQGRQRHISDERGHNTRPKSTPASRLNVSFGDTPRSRCLRFSQVHSAKRRKSLEGLNQTEDSISTIVLSPGYILSRSKERINVTIKTDDFFTETQPKQRKKTKPPDEKDIKISQLHQQISDLILFLEEERLNHKTNLRKTAENHRLHIEQIHQEHRDHISSIEQDHADEIEKLKDSFEQNSQEERSRTEAEKVQITTEMEFLQGAFEAYKETVATEMDYKWQRRENELRHEHEKYTETVLSEQKKELIHEKNKELDAVNKEHQRQIEVLVEENTKEINRLVEKFAECVQDSENLKKVLTQMQVMTQENAELKEKMKITSAKLRKTQTELEDKKVKLAGYEDHFAEKVAEVDNKYSLRMHGLMSDNTDLRRHYIKKCEQVLKLQSKSDVEQEENLRSAKDTMQAVILARARSNVSLTALRTEPQAKHRHSSQRHTSAYRQQRRSSQPTTEEEIFTALQRTAVVEGPSRPRSSVYTYPDVQTSVADKPRPHTSHFPRQASPRLPGNAKCGIRESLLPTPVNVSEQGIENLKLQS